MTAATGSGRSALAVAAALLAVLGASARTGLLDDEVRADPTASRRADGEAAGPPPWTVPSRPTLWMCCAMVFGTVAEGAMNDWSAPT